MRVTKIVLAVVGVACAFTMIGCGQSGQESTVTGQGGGQLTIHQPAPVTLTRGATAQVKITIDRNSIKDPVSIAFQDLPVGVSVAPADMKIVGDEGAYTLVAADGAQLVANHHARVTVGGPKGITASVDLVITVQEKQ